jgi:hypothetical protein
MPKQIKQYDQRSTLQLQLDCVREYERERREEREDWIVSIIGATCAISLIFILAQLINH